MAKKMTLIGKVWKDFLADPKVWGNDAACVECIEMLFDGLPDGDRDMSDVEDTTVVTILDGYFITRDDRMQPLSAVLARWLKSQTCVMMLVEVPVADVEVVKAAVKSVKGRVVQG